MHQQPPPPRGAVLSAEPPSAPIDSAPPHAHGARQAAARRVCSRDEYDHLEHERRREAPRGGALVLCTEAADEREEVEPAARGDRDHAPPYEGLAAPAAVSQ